MQKHNREMSFSLYISALAVTDTVTLLIGQFQYCGFRVINPLISKSQQRILLSWCFCRNISDWCYSGTQSNVQYVPKKLKRLKKTLIEVGFIFQVARIFCWISTLALFRAHSGIAASGSRYHHSQTCAAPSFY